MDCAKVLKEYGYTLQEYSNDKYSIFTDDFAVVINGSTILSDLQVMTFIFRNVLEL